MLELFIPVKTVSELNVREHWSVKSARVKRQKINVWAEWYKARPVIEFPCEVTLIRQSMRFLDDDNLQGSLKAIRDQVADCLIPGLAPGRADGDPKIKWHYSQEKGKPQGVKVIIQEL